MYQTEKNAVPNPEIFRKILIFKIPVIFEKENFAACAICQFFGIELTKI